MDQFDQFDQFNQFDSLLSPTPSPPPPPPPPPQSLVMLALPPLATYPSKDALFEAIQDWAKPRGYAFITSRSKRLESGRHKVFYACDRRATIRNLNTIRIRETQTRGSGCQFSIIGVELQGGLSWEVRYRPSSEFNTHNHLPSQNPAAHPTHRHLSIQAQNTAQTLFSAGNISLSN
jgi:hypothetical protein